MERLGVDVKRQLVHLSKHRPTAPTQNFDTSAPLPRLLTVSAYFAKVNKFGAVTNAIKIEISAVSWITPFGRFSTTNNHKRRVVHSECTVDEILWLAVLQVVKVRRRLRNQLRMP